MNKNIIINNLKKGITINIYTRIAIQSTNFIFGIILARILTPGDYGLVGLLAIFIVIINQFIDSGFGIALLQQDEIKIIDYNSVFILNISIAILLYLLFFLSAKWIADFYNEPKLIPVIKVIGVVTVVKAIGATQGAYLNKSQFYAEQAKVLYIATVTSSIIAVLFAYLGFSYWALVIKSFFNTSILTIGWYIVSPWKPKFQYSGKSIKRLFPFGSRIFASSFFENVFNNIYSLIIGKLFNIKELGYYNRANGFFNMPDMIIRQTLFGKVFPAFSYFQNDNEKLKNLYKKLLVLLSYSIYPVYSIMFFVAYPMISVLLTDKWIISASYLQILTLKAIFFPFESINGNVLYVKGKSNFVFRITVIRRFLFILLIFLTYKYGVKWLLFVLIADSFISTSLYYIHSRKLYTFNLSEQIISIKKVVLISIPMISAMYLLSKLISNNVILLFTIPITGILIYLILSIFFLQKELDEILTILKLNRLKRYLFIK